MKQLTGLIKTQKVRIFLCLISVGTLLSLSLAVSKEAISEGIPPVPLLLSSALAAGLILQLLAQLKGYSLRFNAKNLEYAFITGLIFALTNGLSFIVVNKVGVGYLSVLFTFPILITWLLAVSIGIEKLSLIRTGGVLLCFAGGFLLAMSKKGSASSSILWLLVAFTIPFIVAAGNLYRTFRWPADTHPVHLASLMLIGSSVSLFPFLYFLEEGTVQWISELKEGAAWVLWETVIYVLLYHLFFILQKISGPVYISQIGIIAALSGTVISVMFLDETISSDFMIAATAVGAGVLIFSFSQDKYQQHTKPAK